MKRLYRSKVDRRLFGVCGGLGELFNLDPTFFRIAWVMVAFATGFIPAIIAYIVAWVLVPLKKPLESS
jgi:phage shock protein C